MEGKVDVMLLDNIWFLRLVFATILLTPAISWIIYSKYPIRLLKIVPIGLVVGALYFSVNGVGSIGYGFGFAGFIWTIGFIIFTCLYRKMGLVNATYLAVFLVLFANNVWGTEDSVVSFFTGYFKFLSTDTINFAIFYTIYFINLPFFYRIVNFRRLAIYFAFFCIIFVPLNLLINPINYSGLDEFKHPSLVLDYTNLTYIARGLWILGVFISLSPKVVRNGVVFSK